MKEFVVGKKYRCIEKSVWAYGILFNCIESKRDIAKLKIPSSFHIVIRKRNDRAYSTW